MSGTAFDLISDQETWNTIVAVVIILVVYTADALVLVWIRPHLCSSDAGLIVFRLIGVLISIPAGYVSAGCFLEQFPNLHRHPGPVLIIFIALGVALCLGLCPREPLPPSSNSPYNPSSSGGFP